MSTETGKLLSGTYRKIGGPEPFEARVRTGERLPNGTERQLRQRFRTKKEMLAFDQATYSKRQKIKLGLPAETLGGITFAALVDEVLSHEHDHGSKWDREMLTYSLERFGTTLVREIRPHEIARWINHLEGKSGQLLSGQTRRHALNQLRFVLERGTRLGWLTSNPAGRGMIPAPKLEKKTRLTFKSWDEINYLDSQSRKFGALWRFACGSGLRPEEYLSLQRSDINFEQKTIHVQRVVVDGIVREGEGKTDQAVPRTVLLTAQAERALRDIPTPLQPDGLYFPNKEGHHLNLPNLRSRHWHADLKRAGFEARPLYYCRATYATLTFEATGDISFVAEQLGDSIATAKKYYANFTPDLENRRLNEINAAWSDSTCVESVSEVGAQ